MYIQRKQLENLVSLIRPNRVVVIYGPRRCGKTTLITQYLASIKEKYLLVSGEDIIVQEHLSSQSIARLQNFIGDHKLLVIDEAQKIRNIGLNLKLIVDHISGLKVIASGSASFDLSQQVGEPLTGRKVTLRLFPLAQLELSGIEKTHETAGMLENRLIFGSYPEAITTPGNQEKIRYLKELVSSYLLKDILEFNGIRHSDKLIKILQLLSFQIGHEVSNSELASQTGINNKTIQKYLELLEKVFVLFKISGFSRNLRKEISKNPKYYFYDLGIRNTLINNFNPLEIRNDVGSLWENYLVIERLKKQECTGIISNNYFWRTYDRKEIDWVEEREGKLYAYEFKWKDKKTVAPGDWIKNYPGSEFSVITRENYLDFIC
ncbi:MAG: ATP-binding protein [Planctomycetes bacterium]|nr:ATP-binding protein [Planctomycetota bacterium]